MVYLINPLFLMSNVIYVVPEKRYILIEKSCWNTVVHLIFKRRKPSIPQLRKLKQICFDTYITYSTTSQLDFNLFHRELAALQDLGPEFRDWQVRNVSSFPAEPVTEIQVTEDTFFDGDHIYESKPEDLSLTEEENIHVQGVLSRREGLEDEYKEHISYSIARSPELENIINYIGFGRLVSLFHVLASTEKLRLTNIYEFKFMVYSSNLIARIYKTRKIQFYFFCECCLTINHHLKDYDTQRGLKHEVFVQSHQNKVHYHINGVPIQDFRLNFDLMNLDNSVNVPQVNINTYRLSDLMQPFDCKDFLKIEDFQLILFYNNGTLSYNQVISCHDDLFKLLNSIVFSVLLIEDFDNSDFGKDAKSICASLISRSLYYDRLIVETLFQYCKSYRLDTFFVKGFLNISDECMLSQYDNYIEFFQNSNRDQQNLIDDQATFSNLLVQANKFI